MPADPRTGSSDSPGFRRLQRKRAPFESAPPDLPPRAPADRAGGPRRTDPSLPRLLWARCRALRRLSARTGATAAERTLPSACLSLGVGRAARARTPFPAPEEPGCTPQPAELEAAGEAAAAPAALSRHQVRDLTAVLSDRLPAARSRGCHGRAAGPRRSFPELTALPFSPRGGSSFEQQQGDGGGGGGGSGGGSRSRGGCRKRHRWLGPAAMGRGRRRLSTIRTWADRDVTMARPANRDPRDESSAMMSCGPGANRGTIELS